MPADLSAGYTQNARLGEPDYVRDAGAVTSVVSRARDCLGLTDAAPTARALLKLGRLTPA